MCVVLRLHLRHDLCRSQKGVPSCGIKPSLGSNSLRTLTTTTCCFSTTAVNRRLLAKTKNGFLVFFGFCVLARRFFYFRLKDHQSGRDFTHAHTAADWPALFWREKPIKIVPKRETLDRIAVIKHKKKHVKKKHVRKTC